MAKRSIGRRDFVRTTGGILVAASFGNACTEAGPGAGVVRVTITGLAPGFTSAGSAQISGGDLPAPIIIQLPGVSSGEASVRPGTYDVVYSPPSGYSMAPGSPNEVEVTVSADEVTPVSFAVVAATATLRVTVTGLMTGATSGGSAQVLRTDVGGQTPFTVTVPAAATVDTSVQPGTYSVTYTPPSGHQLTSGQTNPRTITVSGTQTGTATFQVQESSAPPGVVFNSDFGTALGTSDNAVMDAGKSVPWSLRGGQGQEVISSAGLDFPSTNVLRITCLQANSGFALLRKTGLGVPAVGASRFYRWYTRVPIGDGVAATDQETHPHQDGNAASDCNWLWHIYHDAGVGLWRPQLRPASGANAFPNDRWFGPTLSKNVTYRFELQVHRIGANTFNMHARIYNSSNALLHSDSAWNNQQNTGTLAGTPTFNFANLPNMDGFNAGLNGLAGTDWHPSVIYMYQGAIAISGSDWLGPYSGGI